MVAKITTPSSIKRALNYNEQKVKNGAANCLYAHNFLKDAEALNFYEKLDRFESLIVLNKRASTNTVHISLNFAEGENVDRNKLTEIACTYMNKIGFDDQPYLVYQHFDAGHPHLHIVTTNIQRDGKRISLHNLGKNQSNQARKEIEIAFGLVKAEDQKNEKLQRINPIKVEKIVYGKSPTKRAITNVLNAVLSTYKYSSLAELNAVLKLYNVQADKGELGSKIDQNHGLVYRVIDEKENKVGVPIKASSIYSNPTLPFLEQKFTENKLQKEQFKNPLKASIDWTFFKHHRSLESFQQALQKENISLVIRQNDQGVVYGLTYIDHQNKTVFNGSDLGKDYSAKGILERCGIEQHIPVIIVASTASTADTKQTSHSQEKQMEQGQDKSKVLDTLISPVEQQQAIPYPFKKQRKKKRKSFKR